MNRQIRRAEAKKERLQDEKKRKEREARRHKRRERSQRRKANARADGGGAKGEKPEAGNDGGRTPGTKRAPGRFSAVLTFATVFFIALQGVTPTDGSLVNQIVSASFFLLFGYFAVLWMMRRGTDAAVPYAVIGGLLLAAATGVTRWLQPDLALEPWTVGLTPPLLVAGALLGRLVYQKAPA